MSSNLNGLNPLAYVGVNPDRPPNVFTINRDPTANDISNYVIGDIWIYRTANRIYVLTNKNGGVATWLQLSTSGGGDDVQTIEAADGNSIVPDANGKVYIIGNDPLTSSRVDANTISIDLPNGADGQLLIGGGSNPDWAHLTAGSGINIVNGTHSITISTTTKGVAPGTILKFDNTIPAGTSYLDCDGSIVAQADYPDLYNVIGQKYQQPSFSLKTNSFTGTIHCVAHNGQSGSDSLWVAAGTNGELATSIDGNSWTMRTSGFGTDTIYGVAHNQQASPDGLWVIVGANGKLATSPDGINWTMRTSNFPAGYHIYCVAHNRKASPNGLWICGGTSTSYSKSSDGTTWTNHSTSTGVEDLKKIIFNDDKWIFVEGSGGESNIVYSTDASTWSDVFTQNYFRTNNTPGFKDITYGCNRYFTISDGTQANEQLLISQNGYNWMRAGDTLGTYYYPTACKATTNNILIGHTRGQLLFGIHENQPWHQKIPMFLLNSPFDEGSLTSTGDTIKCIDVDITCPDLWWIAVSDNHKIAKGTPGYDFATHFQLPYIPGYVITY